MTEINILSPEKKNRLKEEKVIFLARIMAYAVIVFIVLSLGLLYGAQFYLNQKMEQVSGEISALGLNGTRGSQLNFSGTINQINEKITNLKGVQTDYIKWSAYLAEFSTLIPPEITLSELAVSQETNKIQIRGLAPLRDDFLALKSNLENSPLLENIDSPISNLIKREEINFELSASLVLEDYKL